MPRMTPEQKRKGLIAKIHVAKQQLAMNDDVYRQFLIEITGQSSCKQMDLFQLQRVVAKMERLGFKPTRKNIGIKPLHFANVSAQINKLAVLLKQADKTWGYADGMAQRMFGKQVNQLNGVELRKLIAALNIHILKEQAKQVATL